MATLEAQLRIGDYELIRLLGRGGMGEVWMAHDIRADRRVAVKFIRASLLDDPGFRARFMNEARTLGRLEHDRIVSLYSVIDDGVHLALVLRFIEGKSLADQIDTQGALPLDFVMSCARDLLPALGFAHQKGIIHRDIKPENVLVDSSNRSLLTDFGIAVADFAERGTMTGFSVGTPQYMSPEQIRTPQEITMDRRGYRSDIYSFGVVLFEMLAGRVPFGGDSGVQDIFEVQTAHCTKEPPLIRDLNPTISPELEAVVLRCLAKNPDDRPQSCEDLLLELEGAVRGTSRARAATVFEAAPVVPQALPAKVPQRAIAPKKSGQTKWVWIALGAVFIIAGIIFAAMTSSHGQPPGPSPVADSSSGNSQSAGSGTVPLAANTSSQQGTKGVNPRNPKITSSAQPASGSEPFKLPHSVPTGIAGNGQGVRTEPPPDAEDPEAHRLYSEAKSLFGQGEYCDGKAKIDEAIAIRPSLKYTSLQSQLTKGCNASLH